MQERAAQSWENFYPRPPRGGRPLRVEASAASIPDFYPRPPRGGRRPSFSSPRIRKRFLSTPSARRATELRRQHRLPTPNFYPRPPRGGRPIEVKNKWDNDVISIHALREEGDVDNVKRLYLSKAFLSTPSARRATAKTFSGLFEQQFLSTPSARRATFDKKYESEQPKISIHALREEGDLRRPCSHAGKAHFYPRPPRGGRLEGNKPEE